MLWMEEAYFFRFLKEAYFFRFGKNMSQLTWSEAHCRHRTRPCYNQPLKWSWASRASGVCHCAD
jgi:hypothetical protein